jgi:ATP-dependent DNA helicase RecG
MIEAWGRGIEKMQADCEAYGVPGPVLRHETTGLWVEFENRVTGKIPAKTGEKTREKTGEKTREKILALIAANPAITTEELAEQIGITRKGVEWQISKLKRTGHLERIGPAKGGHWRVVGEDDE